MNSLEEYFLIFSVGMANYIFLLIVNFTLVKVNILYKFNSLKVFVLSHDHQNIYFCFVDYAKVFDYVDHNKLENSSRDGNTRPPELPLEKSVCRSGSSS